MADVQALHARFDRKRTHVRPRSPTRADGYCDSIALPSSSRTLTHSLAVAIIAMAIAGWRLRNGLAMIGDSASYLAGASGLSSGRWFDTPLVPSFSEIPLLDSVKAGGWSPYADFGIGLPVVIAVLDIVLSLRWAAAFVNIASIGLIAAAIVIGPWSSQSRRELWLRSALALPVSGWPIMRFTSTGVLSEPLFCASLIWLVICLARIDVTRKSRLAGLGALTVLVGTTRFVGPVVALVIAVFLVQRGVPRSRAAIWAGLTTSIPLATTFLAAGSGGTRTLAFHPLDSTDVFFVARGVGGWFEAGLGDQTATLLRLDFQPSVFDWLIAVFAGLSALVVMWWWIRSLRRRTTDPLQPALVLAVALAVAVVPSMIFLDAVVKLENRILMPSGLLVIAAAGWAIARHRNAMIAWVVIALWAVISTHPWQWLERPPAPEPTPLTEAVRSLDVDHVVTNNADLVWWITGTPARYLPDGYHDLSDRTYAISPIMDDLPCALAATNGAIVAEANALSPELSDHIADDVATGRYVRRDVQGIVVYEPTGSNC